MDWSSTWTIVVIVVIALLAIGIIAALVKSGREKKRERDRSKAAELRDEAETKATDLQQREARARETEAKAAQARAEADRKAAEAQRLEAEAHDRHGDLTEHRDRHEETLRRADELDPDVDEKEAARRREAGEDATGTTSTGSTNGATDGTHAEERTLVDSDGRRTDAPLPERTTSHETAGEHAGDSSNGERTVADAETGERLDDRGTGSHSSESRSS